jgi:hypothetical protein
LNNKWFMLFQQTLFNLLLFLILTPYPLLLSLVTIISVQKIICSKKIKGKNEALVELTDRIYPC